MFELEEMQGCHSCINEKDFDTEKEPCKSCNGFSHYENKNEFLENASITFIDKENNRTVSYDCPKKIEFFDNGIVVVDCVDGFKTKIFNNEWTKIEIEKW